MTLLSRVNPSGWVAGNLLTPTQINTLDTNIVQLADWLEVVSASAFLNARQISVGAVAAGPVTWVERTTGSFYRFWYMVNASGTAFLSVNGEDSMTDSTPTSATYNDVADNGTDTTILVSSANAYYFTTDYTTISTVASASGVGAIWDGTNFIISSTSAGFRYGDGTSYLTDAGPTNWAAGSNAARQMATSGSLVVAVAVTGSAKQYFAYSSDNGASWSEVSVANLTWVGVAYRPSSAPSGALWMAIADSGEVYTSSTGSSGWSLQATLDSVDVPSSTSRLRYFNDWFCFGSASGQLIFSKDGTTWYYGSRVGAVDQGVNYLAVGPYGVGGSATVAGPTTTIFSASGLPIIPGLVATR